MRTVSQPVVCEVDAVSPMEVEDSGTYLYLPVSSVADPGCLSRILDPDFYPSRISDPRSSTKRGEGKQMFALPFFVATNIVIL